MIRYEECVTDYMKLSSKSSGANIILLLQEGVEEEEESYSGRAMHEALMSWPQRSDCSLMLMNMTALLSNEPTRSLIMAAGFDLYMS